MVCAGRDHYAGDTGELIRDVSRDSVTLLVCMCASSSAFSRSEMSSGCATDLDDSRHAKPCKERRYSRLCGGCMQGGEYGSSGKNGPAFMA